VPTLEIRGVCHSYAIEENNIFLTEIYNRPKSTLRELDSMSSYSKYGDGVFGLTFQNKLVCISKSNNITKYFQTTLKMVNSFRSVSVTSFAGCEKSGNHLWTHMRVHFPTSYSMILFNLHTKFNAISF
jgi:hypothetical protein